MDAPEKFDLTTAEGLARAIAREPPGSDQRLTEIGVFDGTFCPRCGAARRMRLVTLFWEDRWATGRLRFAHLTAGDGTSSPPAPVPPCRRCGSVREHPRARAEYLAAFRSAGCSLRSGSSQR